MLKVVSRVVALGVVVAQLSTAQAATEVAHFPANNRFANVVVNAPDGTSTGVFVTREIGASGGPVDRIGFIISRPDGIIVFGSGVLPNGAFHFNANSASVDVDVNDIILDTLIGDIPENSVISIDWEGTDLQRTAGNNVADFGNLRVIFSGVTTAVVADVTGTVFGVPLGDAVGDLMKLSQQVTVITTE
jgi:hypothetical protein